MCDSDDEKSHAQELCNNSPHRGHGATRWKIRENMVSRTIKEG